MRRLPLAVILAFVLAAPSHAIPAFARKYGFNCAMCHIAWPKLNDFGQKFRMNGYQIPGQEELEKTVLQVGGPPLSLRTSAGFTNDAFMPSLAEPGISQWQINGLDILGGGIIGLNKGFFLAYLPQIEGGNGVEAQAAEMEQANVIFTRLRSTYLNARIGRYEGAYLAFSSLRRISISPYEIYEFNGSPDVSAPDTRGSLNDFRLGDTATGLEITGWGRSQWQYAIGSVNGSRGNTADDGPSDYYIRGAYIAGPGFGQSAGQRFGFTTYFGRARAMGIMTKHGFTRLGLDANLNKAPFNAQIQYIWGQDTGGFNAFVPDKPYKISGGFVELNYFAMESAIFARYDWVSTPSEDDHGITRITAGWRHHLEHNLMLQLEYSIRRVANGASPGVRLREDFYCARLDWAF
jgi:hypothetical protein